MFFKYFLCEKRIRQVFKFEDFQAGQLMSIFFLAFLLKVCVIISKGRILRFFLKDFENSNFPPHLLCKLKVFKSTKSKMATQEKDLNL